jgi:hypothetical protein
VDEIHLSSLSTDAAPHGGRAQVDFIHPADMPANPALPGIVTMI